MRRSLLLLVTLLAACSDGSRPGPVAPPAPEPGPDPAPDPSAAGLAIDWDGQVIDWGEPLVLRASLDGAPAPEDAGWVSLDDTYLGQPVVLGRGPEIATRALRPGTTRVEVRLDTAQGTVRDTVEVTVRYRESWNMALEAHVPYPAGTVGDVWVAGEVAIVARRSALGASVVGLDDPIGEIGRFEMPGLFTQDVKAEGDLAFLSNEGGGFSVAILDLSDPSRPALVGTVPGDVAPRAHNVWIEGTQLTVATGRGPAILVDVSDPAAPRALGMVDGQSHDAHTRDGLLFGAFVGEVAFADLSNPAAPVVLSRIPVPGAYIHTTWLSADGRWLYVTDERKNSPIRIFDVSDPAVPVLAGTYQPRLGAVPHNFQVRDGRFAYLSHYVHGVEVLDVSDPIRPRLVGFHDTRTGADDSGSYAGAWGVHWTADGRIVASDMQTGLYVLRYTGD